MKLRPTQFGVRENTTSPRQHASRLAVDTRSNIAHLAEENLETQLTSSHDGTTVGDGRDERHLLKVLEVAELLQVSVSWVYGRVRKRSSERLPGYRLGKYWRFRKDEVLAWVDSHCGGSHAA